MQDATLCHDMDEQSEGIEPPTTERQSGPAAVRLSCRQRATEKPSGEPRAASESHDEAAVRKSECLLQRDGEEMLESALSLSLLNSSSSSSSSAEDFLPTSLRSGCGLALVGSVCSRQPPDDSSSRSLEFLHFILRFWNQIFTCRRREERRRKKRPSLEANFFLSGLLMYFCFWNIFSRALRCTSENTALLSIPLRGFPLAARGQEKPPTPPYPNPHPSTPLVKVTLRGVWVVHPVGADQIGHGAESFVARHGGPVAPRALWENAGPEKCQNAPNGKQKRE
ncbi:hypothetical protein EYF80_030829 [Liparis tanakae]|uniref:Uncharacterized protein n=1 Tax=Liparis tanakae TaxID=230148 RepID=A0A4Z2GZG4_9TELE|nr:hypothetical protein EYF80_030829 [Liparis tanakae]